VGERENEKRTAARRQSMCRIAASDSRLVKVLLFRDKEVKG